MIKTLKAELNLRPTYDEMIGMIEAQGDPNRPSIETVIDRRATIFRNNQFGSQFDNVDFLGLKKQEEDRARENLRQAQLRNAGIDAGTSTGIMNLRAMGFETPEIIEEDFVYETMDGDELTVEEATKIRAEMERYIQRQQETKEETASSARSDLDEAHRQSIPAGVEMFRMDTGGSDASSPNEDLRSIRNASGEASRGSRDDLPPLIDIPPETRIQQPSSSTSGTLKDIVVSGAKAGVETLAKAGATALAKSFLPVENIGQ